MAITYDDFVKKAQEAGVYDQFSQYDLELAKNYPEFGMAITQNKIDWKNATTDEARVLANAAAEANRAKYGSYSGGADGGSYTALTPGTYQSQYQGQINDALNTLSNYGSFNYSQTAPTYSFNQTAPTFDASAYTAPTYSGYSGTKPTYSFSETQPTYNFKQTAPTYSGYNGTKPTYSFNEAQPTYSGYNGTKPTYSFSEAQPTYSGYNGTKPTYSFSEAQPEYQGYNVAQPEWTGYGEAPIYNNPFAAQQQELLDKVVNRGEFTWDENDPNWVAYKKQYRREGDRATANALGQAAAATGGIPSSYAVTAASQAGDYYAAQLSDMLPAVYQQAYNRWINELGLDRQALDAVNQQQQIDYQRYLTELGQYNTDRNFSYNDYLTNLNQWNTNRNFDFNTYLAALDQYNANRNAAQNMYGLDLSQYNTDRSFDFNTYLAALDQYNANRNAAQNMYSLDLSQYNTDRSFDFNTYLAALDQYNANRNAAQNMYSLDLSQYNNDRNFDFNTYLAALDQFNADRNAAQNLYSMDLNQYNANRNAAQNMYLAALDQYNTDRSFDYNQYLTQLDQFNTDRSLDFNTYLAAQDQYNADRNAAQNMYLAALDQYNTDRSFAYNDYLTQYDMAQNNLAAMQEADNTAYGRYIDNLNYNTQLRQEAQAAQELAYNRAWNEAAIAADLGDYSKFNALGIDTSNNPADYQRKYNAAVLAAQYGDYSGLEALGVRPNMTNINTEALASGGKLGATEALNGIQIMTLQNALGVPMDGDFGSVSTQALLNAGYYDLNTAYNDLVVNGKSLPEGYSSGYNGGSTYSGGYSDYSGGNQTPNPTPSQSGPSDYEKAVQNFLANGAVKYTNSDETNIAIMKRNGMSDVEAANMINIMHANINDQRMQGAAVGVPMTEKEIRAWLDKTL